MPVCAGSRGAEGFVCTSPGLGSVALKDLAMSEGQDALRDCSHSRTPPFCTKRISLRQSLSTCWLRKKSQSSEGALHLRWLIPPRAGLQQLLLAGLEHRGRHIKLVATVLNPPARAVLLQQLFELVAGLCPQHVVGNAERAERLTEATRSDLLRPPCV
jgi:hypothetical protein